MHPQIGEIMGKSTGAHELLLSLMNTIPLVPDLSQCPGKYETGSEQEYDGNVRIHHLPLSQLQRDIYRCN